LAKIVAIVNIIKEIIRGKDPYYRLETGGKEMRRLIFSQFEIDPLLGFKLFQSNKWYIYFRK